MGMLDREKEGTTSRVHIIKQVTTLDTGLQN